MNPFDPSSSRTPIPQPRQWHRPHPGILVTGSICTITGVIWAQTESIHLLDLSGNPVCGHRGNGWIGTKNLDRVTCKECRK